jgi:type II secretory ATPase GspE/PulE/Tfp pilus assembly ATPase PilB-like protein
MEKDLLVRYRIDGMCQEKLRLPKQVANALVTRLKIMCNLDISERRLPQDGRIVFKKYTKKNIDIDLRVATGPDELRREGGHAHPRQAEDDAAAPALGFSEENLAGTANASASPTG